MLLVDATTAEHALGIGTVIQGVLDGIAKRSEPAIVVTGPTLTAPPNLEVRCVRLASTRPGRLLYQRALLPFDARRLDTGGGVDRVLLLDAYAPVLRPFGDMRYAALVHDVLPLSHPAYWPIQKRLVKRIAFAALRHGVTLFTSTEHNAREIERLLGVEARQVRFGCGQLSDSEADNALALPLPEQRPYLLYVGALEPRKDVLSLVGVFDHLLSRLPGEMRLILVGGGRQQYVDALRDRILSSRAPHRFEMRRHSDRESLLELVRHASAVVIPSRAEGFALPVIEALALGTPVVATDIPGIRSWAGDAVVYAQPGDLDGWLTAVRGALALDESERRRRQEWVSTFRWSECAAELTRF